MKIGSCSNILLMEFYSKNGKSNKVSANVCDIRAISEQFIFISLLNDAITLKKRSVLLCRF